MNFILEENKLGEFLKARKEQSFRLKQILDEVYKGEVPSFNDLTNLSLGLREGLSKEFEFESLKVKKVLESKEQVVKFLFETFDGAQIESVLMFHLTGRVTLCISSQVGCAMACEFCATGKMGLTRNLEFSEILDQYLMTSRWLHENKPKVKIRNIVLMGMGEPFANKKEVFKVLDILIDQKKINIGSRHITVSTCGVIPGILELAEKFPQIKLAISLHAPTDELRTKIMPVNKQFPLGKLMETLDNFVKITGKRVFYEYVLLKDVNDTFECAEELGKLLQNRKAHVNLIPWNEVSGINFKESNILRQKKFQEVLEKYKIPSTIRANLGRDVKGACGQLAGES